MEKLKKIFEREYNEALEMGESINRAIYWALDWIETGVNNVRTRFNYEKFREVYAEHYNIYEAEKEKVEKEREQRRIEDLRKKSVIKFHSVDSTFNIITGKKKFKVKVIEQGHCRGCFFSKVTGYAQGGYFIYGCRYDYVNKNAYCSAEMREDQKNVAYIPVK